MTIKNTSRAKLYTILGIIILAIIALMYKTANKKEDKIKQILPPATVAKAKIAPVIRYINAIGTLSPNDSVTIKSEVNSLVKTIHFEEGTHVNHGDTLIELDDVGARASLKEAEAQYMKAKSEYEPIAKLAAKGVVATIEKDKKKAEMDMCEARVLANKNTLEKHIIKAPFNGIIGFKEISTGQYVSPGQELVKLVDYHPLKVDFKVAESDISKIYIGQEAKILIGASHTDEYTSKITAISPESEQISHSFKIRAILENNDENMKRSSPLKPGRFVSIKIIPNEAQNGIVVPEGAVEKIGGNSYVYRLIDGVASRGPVSTGLIKDGNIEILYGVNANDIVITSGHQNILDGRGITIQTSNGENISTKKHK